MSEASSEKTAIKNTLDMECFNFGCLEWFTKHTLTYEELYLAENYHNFKSLGLNWHPVSDCFQYPWYSKRFQAIKIKPVYGICFNIFLEALENVCFFHKNVNLLISKNWYQKKEEKLACLIAYTTCLFSLQSTLYSLQNFPMIFSTFFWITFLFLEKFPAKSEIEW